MSDPTAAALDQSGPAAPPRRNGELVFQAPWESRVFGIAIALRDSGKLDWEEFRQQLIAEIAAAEARSEPPPAGAYYRHWQRALEHVLERRRLCTDAEIGGRAIELASRPAGHDHGHEHHGHDHTHDDADSHGESARALPWSSRAPTG